MLLLAFFILISTGVSTKHPYYISVAEIHHNRNLERLEITLRIFVDDLEKAIALHQSLPSFYITNPDDPSTRDMIRLYLDDRFRLAVNREAASMEFLGGEVEDDTYWAYLKVDGVVCFDQLEIEYIVLLEVFEEQLNLVHVQQESAIRTFRLTADTPIAIYRPNP